MVYRHGHTGGKWKTHRDGDHGQQPQQQQWHGRKKIEKSVRDNIHDLSMDTVPHTIVYYIMTQVVDDLQSTASPAHAAIITKPSSLSHQDET